MVHMPRLDIITCAHACTSHKVCESPPLHPLPSSSSSCPEVREKVEWEDCEQQQESQDSERLYSSSDTLPISTELEHPEPSNPPPEVGSGVKKRRDHTHYIYSTCTHCTYIVTIPLLRDKNYIYTCAVHLNTHEGKHNCK